jgi:hypothetical protein
MTCNFEHFATKGIHRNLKAPRSFVDAGSYYPITTFEDEPHSASKSILGAFLGGFLVGCIFSLLLTMF